MNLIKIIKSLSHKNRLRILNLIREQDLCVCEIEYLLNINQSNASRHLSKLKQANIIYGERKAQWIYYHINSALIKKHKFLELIIDEELSKLKACKKDNEKLKEYQASNLSCKDLN